MLWYVEPIKLSNGKSVQNLNLTRLIDNHEESEESANSNAHSWVFANLKVRRGRWIARKKNVNNREIFQLVIVPLCIDHNSRQQKPPNSS